MASTGMLYLIIGVVFIAVAVCGGVAGVLLLAHRQATIRAAYGVMRREA